MAKFLWITDPWPKLAPYPLETTLRLVRESIVLGHKSYWCNLKTIRLEGSKVFLDAELFDEKSETDHKPKTYTPDEFRSLQYRADPPIDLGYLQPLQLLEFALRGKKKSEMVNPFDVLFRRSEKIEPLALPELAPPTIVTSQIEALRNFGKKHGKVVVKPLFQAGSRGVALLDWLNEDPRSLDEKLNTATLNQTQAIVIQKFFPAIADGEQRLWFIDGKFLGNAVKLPKKDDFRVDIDAGSAMTYRPLTAKEKKAAAKIGKYLKASKIRLAAVDLIEARITDFNFTSPGLIVQMEQILGVNLAKPIIQALAKNV